MPATPQYKKSRVGKPSFRDLHNGVITVSVGPTDEVFVIHKGLLCYHSPFFQAALNGSWAEAKSGVINLPTDKVEVVKVFEEWLYTSKLNPEDWMSKGGMNITDILVFGDKIGAQEFHNAVMDVLVRECEQSPEELKPEIVLEVYEKTGPSSPLRHLLVNHFALNVNLKGKFSVQIESYPQDFVN